MKLIFLNLILIFCIQLTHSEDSKCTQDLIKIAESQTLVKFLTWGGPAAKYIDVMKMLIKSPRFLSFLIKKKIKSISLIKPTNLGELAAEYIDYLNRVHYTEENLRKERSLELLRSLKKHGAKIPKNSKDGFEALKIISAENKKRILSGVPAFDDSNMQEEKEILDSLHYVFVHRGDTKHFKNSRLPNMSSRERVANGFLPGLHSKHDFNKKELRSDNNVFFSAQLSNPLNRHPGGDIIYGKNRYELDPAYAKENAWISAYVMDDKDLVPLAERLGLPDAWSNDRIGDLHKMDFTVEDFESLVKRLLLYQLWKFKSSGSVMHSSLMSVLKSSTYNLDSAVDDIVYKSFSMVPKFELKVPVAIGFNHLNYVVNK
jgi:hypothetical protein